MRSIKVSDFKGRKIQYVFGLIKREDSPVSTQNKNLGWKLFL